MSTDEAISVGRNDGHNHDISSFHLPSVPLPLSMQGGDQKTSAEELMELWDSSQKEYSSPNAKASCSEEVICAPRTEKDHLDVSSLHLAGATMVVYDPDKILGAAPSSSSSRSISRSSLSAAQRVSPNSDTISLTRTDNNLVDVGTFETTSSKERSAFKGSGRHHLAYTPSPPVPEEDDGAIHVHRSEVNAHIQVNASARPQPLPKCVAVPAWRSPSKDADVISIPRSGGSGVSSIGSGSDIGGSNISMFSRISSGGSDGGDSSVISASRATVSPHIVVDTKLLQGVASITDAGLVPARRRSVSSSGSVTSQGDLVDDGSIHVSRGKVSAHLKVDPSALANTGGLGLGLDLVSPGRNTDNGTIQLRRTDECKAIGVAGGVAGGAAGSETRIRADPMGCKAPRKKRWSFTDPSTSGSPQGQPQPADTGALRLPLSVFARLTSGRYFSDKTATNSTAASSSAHAAAKPKRRSWATPGDAPAAPSPSGSDDGDMIVLRRSDVTADFNVSNTKIKLPPRSLDQGSGASVR